MPVCSIVILLPLGTMDDLMHYCTRPKAKVSLKILNLADSNSFLDLFSVYLHTIDHLNLKLLIFKVILQVLRYDFQKFRI